MTIANISAIKELRDALTMPNHIVSQRMTVSIMPRKHLLVRKELSPVLMEASEHALMAPN